MTEFLDKTYGYQPERANSLTYCQQHPRRAMGHYLLFIYKTYTYEVTDNRAQEVH